MGRFFLQIHESGNVEFEDSSAKEYVEGRHIDNEADLYLARKCLAALSQDVRRRPETALKLLRRHLMRGTKYGLPADDSALIESAVYRYAVQYFHEHLSILQNPPQDVILKVGRFLRGIEFVTWSETLRDLKPSFGYSKVLTVYISLYSWTQRLSESAQKEVALGTFFELPHTRLAEILKDVQPVWSQYLPGIRIGEYYNSIGQSYADWRKAYEAKKTVAVGLESILGSQDPFVMKIQADLYVEFLWQKRFPEARDKLQHLYQLQKDLGDPDKDDIYVTAWILAGVYIALNEVDTAQAIITDTIKIVKSLFGKTYRLFLLLSLLEGTILEIQGLLDKAATRYQEVQTALTNLLGVENGFTYMAMTALGSIFRKQGKFEEALPLLFEGWAGRQRRFSININLTVDAALHLALLYRDMGNADECLQTMAAIRKSEVFVEDLGFERRCQLVHIQSLVDFDCNNYTAGKSAIFKLIEEASGEKRDYNNRDLLWARLDASEAMQRYGEVKESLMLFTGLVCAEEEIDPDLQDQPEPASQLTIARDALALVRQDRKDEAQKLLKQHRLRWVSEADFYILIQGGPTLDTSVIRPIYRS